MDEEEHPTCDLCGDRAYGRYRHRTEDRWIDVCSPHTPSNRNKLPCYHTVKSDAYPATVSSAVSRPNAVIRSE